MLDGESPSGTSLFPDFPDTLSFLIVIPYPGFSFSNPPAKNSAQLSGSAWSSQVPQCGQKLLQTFIGNWRGSLARSAGQEEALSLSRAIFYFTGSSRCFQNLGVWWYTIQCIYMYTVHCTVYYTSIPPNPCPQGPTQGFRKCVSFFPCYGLPWAEIKFYKA